jgi:hypothetical protein
MELSRPERAVAVAALATGPRFQEGSISKLDCGPGSQACRLAWPDYPNRTVKSARLQPKALIF